MRLLEVAPAPEDAYARIRDDIESQRKFAEIKLRVCVKIGEISRDLEKAQTIHTEGPGADAYDVHSWTGSHRALRASSPQGREPEWNC